MIPINFSRLQKIRHWRMVTAWMVKSSREGLHKLLSSGCNGWTGNNWGLVEVRLRVRFSTLNAGLIPISREILSS